MLEGNGFPQLRPEQALEHEFNISISSILENNTHMNENSEDEGPNPNIETPAFPHRGHRQRLSANQVPVCVMQPLLDSSAKKEELQFVEIENATKQFTQTTKL